MSNVNCYMVRTLSELVDKGAVGVGWVDYNFVEIGDAEEVISQVNQHFGIGRRANQVRRFFNMKEGDLVVVPFPYSVAIGTVASGLFYDEAYYGHDRANQRKVNFPRNEEGNVIKVPRNAFSEAFQRRLRLQMAVNGLNEFSKDISDAYATLQCDGKNYTWISQVIERKNEELEMFKGKLLSNIRQGNTNLQTGGVGLEHVVKELLEAEGYDKSDVLSKKEFPGGADADVLGTRSDLFSSASVLIQVKHHSGYSDGYGLTQLSKIRELTDRKYDACELIFLTSAEVGDQVRKKAAEHSIAIIDGVGLAEWISEKIECLSSDTKTKLGIYEVPAVL